MKRKQTVTSARAFTNLRSVSRMFYDLAHAADTPPPIATAILDRVERLESAITIARRCYVRAIQKIERNGLK